MYVGDVRPRDSGNRQFKESFQPIIGSGRLENDVSVRDKPNRKRTYMGKRRSMKTMLCRRLTRL